MKKSHSRRETIKLAGSAIIASGAASAITACESKQSSKKKSFDYIIIGAGSAGCVLAARLTENPNIRVLLLEAGPISKAPLIDDPKNWFRLTFGEYVWPDKGTPQAHADGKQLAAVHGKLAGGSSAINAMIHHRPTPGDINAWGLASWRWGDLAPMLSRSETWLNGPSPTRGKTGPIKVMGLPDAPPLAEATLAAAERLGHGVSDDLNGEVQLGAGLNQLAFDGSKRQHTGHAYLGPALERPNLAVKTGALAYNLLFDGKDRCVGVKYEKDGEIQSDEAERVILSAGALRSPALLMRSGIGPADHLSELDISVRTQSNGVGANLHDHMLIAGHNFATQTKVPDSALHGSVAIVYGVSEFSNGNRDLMLNVSTTPTVFAPLHTPDHGFKTTFSFTKPKSRGHLRLASNDPFTQPIIDHNIFSDADDLNGAIAALNLSRDILGAREFKPLGGVEQNLDFLKTRDGMRQLILAGTTSFGHHCGTCHMGSDDTAVVDENLRVRGAQGLYVIDASIIPNIPSCPTNALVVAMAELAAERLKNT